VGGPLSVIAAGHTLKMGGEARRFRFDRLQGFPANRNYYFGAIYTSNPSVTQSTGLPYPISLLGLPTSVINSSSKDWSPSKGPLRRCLSSGRLGSYPRKLTWNLGFALRPASRSRWTPGLTGGNSSERISSTGRRASSAYRGRAFFRICQLSGPPQELRAALGVRLPATRDSWSAAATEFSSASASRTIRATDMALSLLNFPEYHDAPALRETTIAPLYRFTSPLVVDSSIDPEFSRYSTPIR